ncbi:uncharacterized protein LOC125757559 isoform X2 [Rhipicephalus sanguineus]|uniref:uncharacterized protein LOC125757559 isoform X2 n=1 Tax=Rhipicephalus sanguineus TaxID=34632 RepID=UPI0020C20B8B|nr:uncharacterized protein LOC125757559 isoform X2 [Rhipicephalus sanguineus]
MALCGALSSQCTSGPRDDSLLCALTPLLEVALGYSRGQVHDRAVHLWQSLFAHSPGLHVQPRLRELLRKVKPSLVPYVEPEGSEICEPASFSQEFVKVVSPIKKKQVLTEHQKEVRKERRSLPALYSNLSQSGLDSQDSETPQESEEMDDEPFTSEKNQTLESMPVIVLDSDSDENGMPPEDPPGQEVCCTPPLQNLHAPSMAKGDVVPETQQTSVETPKASKHLETLILTTDQRGFYKRAQACIQYHEGMKSPPCITIKGPFLP